MKESGGKELRSERVKDFKSGRMGRFMKDGGLIIRLMEEEGSFMQNLTYTKGIGLTTRLMDMESICMLMDQPSKGTGRRTNKMGKEWRLGLMEPYMKDITRMERRKEWEYSNGQMDLSIKESLKIMILRGKVNICGMMVEYSMGNGKRIK